MAKYTIEVDDTDLGDMLVGRLMREGRAAVERIRRDGALAYIGEDTRVLVNMAVNPHRNWFVPVLENEHVQDSSIVTGDIAREIGPEYAAPWRDESEEAPEDEPLQAAVA